MLKISKKLFSKISFNEKFFYQGTKAKVLDEVIRDVNNYHKYFTFCDESSLTSKESENKFQATFKYDYLFFEVEHVVDFTCEQNEQNGVQKYSIIQEGKNDSKFHFLNSKWEFYNEGDNLIIDYSLQMDVKEGKMQKVREFLKELIPFINVDTMIMQAYKKQNPNKKFLNKFTQLILNYSKELRLKKLVIRFLQTGHSRFI